MPETPHDDVTPAVPVPAELPVAAPPVQRKRSVQPSPLQRRWRRVFGLSLLGTRWRAAAALHQGRIYPIAQAVPSLVVVILFYLALVQLDELAGDDSELGTMIDEFRKDERAHRQAALDAGAERAPGYPLLSGAIRLGCRLAIRLSERV